MGLNFLLRDLKGENMRKSFLTICSLFALSVTAQAQPPAGVVSDGFSDEAAAYLKKNPKIEKCADNLAEQNNKARKKQGLEERTTYAEYGEFIGACAKKAR